LAEVKCVAQRKAQCVKDEFRGRIFSNKPGDDEGRAMSLIIDMAWE